MTADLHPSDPHPQLNGAPAGRLRRGERFGAQPARGRMRPQGPANRLAGWLRELPPTSGERQERALEQRLDELARGLSQTDQIAVLSPKSGVGKITCTLLVGDALARHGWLRCVAVDANPDGGTLGSLAPDQQRSERSLLDLLDHADEVTSPGELRPFCRRLTAAFTSSPRPPARGRWPRSPPSTTGGRSRSWKASTR